MCGIFGIVSATSKNIYKRIINSIIQLQNRGYNLSGLCVNQELNNNKIKGCVAP